MSHYPFWFTTINDILVLSTKQTSEDAIRTDDALQAFATMHRGVIFDMSDSDYCSSATLGACIHLHKMLSPLKRRLKLVTNNPEILEVLNISRVPLVQLLFPTIDEAVNSDW